MLQTQMCLSLIPVLAMPSRKSEIDLRLKDLNDVYSVDHNTKCNTFIRSVTFCIVVNRINIIKDMFICSCIARTEH